MAVRILQGDCREVLRTLADASVHCCVTSPPYYGLRDYGASGQMGLEPTPDEFIAGMVEVFREVRRVLRDDGTLWLNMGDSYATSGGSGWQGKSGLRSDRRFTGTRGTVAMREQARTAYKGYKPKDLMGIPWMLAFALRADGWYLRQDIIWSKPNPMPESVRDRCIKAHEYLFLLSKSPRYYFNSDAIREPLAQSSIERLSQDLASQKGSDRVPGKTNGPMKAVMRGGVSRADYEDRKWDERSDGLSRPPMTMRDRVYNDLGRNKRSVWNIATQPFKEGHFATFPPALVKPCILAGAPQGGWVLDPFGGAGTTGLVADRQQRNAILIELNPEYVDIASRRITGDAPLFAEATA